MYGVAGRNRVPGCPVKIRARSSEEKGEAYTKKDSDGLEGITKS